MSILKYMDIKQLEDGKAILENDDFVNDLNTIEEEEKYKNNYQTGDLILFYGESWISKMIQWFTGCRYSHIAIILKDPTYICESMKGLYILEANYPTSKSESTIKKTLNGVQIVEFSDIFHRDESIYWEKLDCDRNLTFHKKIKDLHSKIHHLPYDISPMDWIKAEISIVSGKQVGKVKKENTFFCSALVGYIYNKLGFIDDNIDWTILSPRFFSCAVETSKFKNCKLHSEIHITE